MGVPTAKRGGIFKKKFDPRSYLATYYPIDRNASFLLSAIKKIRKIYDQGRPIDIRPIIAKTKLTPELVENLLLIDFLISVLRHYVRAHPEGGVALEVGGGPTIYQHLPLALATDRIVHTEYLPANRAELDRWLGKEHGAYNWDVYFDLTKKLLADDKEYLNVIERYVADKSAPRHHKRAKILLTAKGLSGYKQHVRDRLGARSYFGDFFKQGLGLPAEIKQKQGFDLVTSNFAVESATGERAEWHRGMHNIMALVRPGGFLALSGIRNAEWYAVGEERLPAVPINEKDLRALCKEEGFHIAELRVLTGSPKKEVGYDGMVFLLAQRV